jgi:hypothetical protein
VSRGTIGTASLVLLVVAVSAVAFVKHQDEDNQFCISCHLHGEFYRRMVDAPPATLAAAHYHYPAKAGAANAGHPERCFTCHSGEGVTGWTQVTVLSAWDAARWVLGDRHESTAMRLPLTNAACLKCHAAAVRGTKSSDETYKFHELSDHRAVTTACIACHVVHASGTAAKSFLDDATVHAQCQHCHRNLDQQEG